MKTALDPNWLHISAIVIEVGKTVEEVTEDILRGVYRNPMRHNGEWFVKRDEVERVFFAALTPERFSAPHRRSEARPSWARTDAWYDISIPPVRRHRAITYVSFTEAARMLGTTYSDVYSRAKSGQFKTDTRIHGHRYITWREVDWFGSQQQRNRRSA